MPSVGLGLDLGATGPTRIRDSGIDEHPYRPENEIIDYYSQQYEDHQRQYQLQAFQNTPSHDLTGTRHHRQPSQPAFPQYDANTNTYHYRFKPLVIDKSSLETEWHIQHPLNPKLPLQKQVVRELGEFEQQRLFSEENNIGPTKGIVPIYASPNADSLGQFPYKNSLTPASLISPGVMSPIPSPVEYDALRQSTFNTPNYSPSLSSPSIWSESTSSNSPNLGAPGIAIGSGAIPSRISTAPARLGGLANAVASGNTNALEHGNLNENGSKASITGSTGYTPILEYPSGQNAYKMPSPTGINLPKRNARVQATTNTVDKTQAALFGASISSIPSSSTSMRDIPQADQDRTRYKSRVGSRYSSSPSVTNVSPILNTGELKERESTVPATQRSSRIPTESTVIHRPLAYQVNNAAADTAATPDVEAQNTLSDKEWQRIPHPLLLTSPYEMCPPLLSKFLLAICVLFPPLWLLLGTGLFDQAVGVVPLRIKQAALMLAVVSAVVVIACLIVGLAVGL